MIKGKVKSLLFLLIGIICGLIFNNIKGCACANYIDSSTSIEKSSLTISDDEISSSSIVNSGRDLFGRRVKKANTKLNNHFNISAMVQDREQNTSAFINLQVVLVNIEISNGVQLRSIAYSIARYSINGNEQDFIPSTQTITFLFTDNTGSYSSIEQLDNEVVISSELDFDLTTKKLNFILKNQMRYGTAETTTAAFDLGNFTMFDIDYIFYQNENTISNDNLLRGFADYTGDNYNLGYENGVDDVQKNPGNYGLRTEQEYSDYGTKRYNEGTQTNISTNWIWAILDTISGFCQIEILPGIKLIYLGGIALVLVFVKFILGWIK